MIAPGRKRSAATALSGGFGLPLQRVVDDKIVGAVEQLPHHRQVVGAEAIRLFPLLALLVGAGYGDAVKGAFLAVVAPDGRFKCSRTNFVNRFRFRGHSASFD